jgi:hypothetical protein
MAQSASRECTALCSRPWPHATYLLRHGAECRQIVNPDGYYLCLAHGEATA